jgi:hypothetical protein
MCVCTLEHSCGFHTSPYMEMRMLTNFTSGFARQYQESPDTPMDMAIITV